MKQYNHPLKFLMYSKGYTRETLAKKMGMDKSTLTSMFAGRTKKPQPMMLKTIADALDVPLEDVKKCFNL